MRAVAGKYATILAYWMSDSIGFFFSDISFGLYTKTSRMANDFIAITIIIKSIIISLIVIQVTHSEKIFAIY